MNVLFKTMGAFELLVSYVQFDNIKGDIFSMSHCRGHKEIHNSNRFLLFLHHQ